MKRSEIIDAYLFLREHNHSISSEMLDFIYHTSLNEFDKLEENVQRQGYKDFHFPEMYGSSIKILKDTKEVTRNDLKTEEEKLDKMCLVPLSSIESLEKVRDKLLDYYPKNEYLFTVASIPFMRMSDITQGLYEVYGRNYKVIPK